MQIRSQYLIQDNHNDYTSEPLPSHGPLGICLLSCTHVCASLPTSSPPFCGTHAYPLHPLPRPRPRPRSLSLSLSLSLSAFARSVYAWKLEVLPRCPAAARGSRGKNATLLIIKYARDAVWEGRTGGRRARGLCVIRGCTVWFGSTSPERSTKEFQRNSRELWRRLFGGFRKKILFYLLYEKKCQCYYARSIKWLHLNTR